MSWYGLGVKVITWRYEAKDCVAILVLLLLQVMGLQISHLLTRTLGMSIYSSNLCILDSFLPRASSLVIGLLNHFALIC